MAETHWPAEEAQLWALVTQIPIALPIPVSVAVHAAQEVQSEGVEEVQAVMMQLGSAATMISASKAGAAWQL